MSALQNLPSIPDYEPSWGGRDFETKKDEDHALCEHGGGYGVFQYYNGHNLPDQVYAFMHDQYKRFGIMPPQMDLMDWCVDHALEYIDIYDPYALMSGCCDVIKTDECYYYQYKVSSDGVNWEEAHPNDVETFAYWDKGTEAWERIMQEPGLKAYFDHIYDYFQDHFFYIMEDSHPECYTREWALIKKYGDKIEDIAHLGIWAAIMWMSSPLKEAKEWRYDHHPIFQTCYDEGAAVLHGWTFHSPEYFKREERPAQSCHHCGVDQYCVELTQIDSNNTAYVCEHCLSGGDPFPGRICGTNMCDRVVCPNHPQYSTDITVARRRSMDIAANKRFGELHDVKGGKQSRELPGYVKLNEIAMNHYAGQIASAVGDDLARLLSPPKES